jgi:GDP/UDP-N,N'-diacetylbacillosamine 2-epimerase (hydrolysing)
MKKNKFKIGILTSSRADYGIYLPLLDAIKKDPFFKLEIIAFGSHLSKGNGYTVATIEKDKFKCIHKITTLLSNDDEQSIASSYGITVLKFAEFWANHKFDLVLCLGDRFEMSAAVQAGIPFQVKFAHIHGGESTLGAIDNIYRHQITIASSIHFTSTQKYSEKVIQLLGSDKNVFSVGSLSLDGIKKIKPIKKEDFCKKFKIPNTDFVLATFHPETVEFKNNMKFAKEMRKALSQICDKITVIITMPNADTLGSLFREEIINLKSDYPDKIICIENFGKVNYFSAMQHCKVIIGNSSSGIIEAASFGKYVIDVGDRQKGRITSENVIHVKFKSQLIIDAFNKIKISSKYNGSNIYYKENSVQNIINNIKNIYEIL